MGIIRLVVMVIASLIGLALSLPAVLLAVPFLVIGVLSRWLLRVAPLEPDWVPWDELVEYEPEVGWKPRANLDTYGRGDDIFHLTTDANGWRGEKTIAESEVVVFGDSFAFGHGIDDAGFFANLTHRPRVKPIACDGYSMVPGLLWMRRLQDRLAGKLVVWMIYLGNDLSENIRPNHGPYRMPFVRRDRDTGRWQLQTDHVSPEPWPFPTKRPWTEVLAQVCTPSPSSQRIFSVAEHLLDEASALCAAGGARLAVVTVPAPDLYRRLEELRRLSSNPDAFDPGLPDARLRQACADRGIAFEALRDHLIDSDYLEHDIHWRPSGHRKVAAVIGELWEAERLPSQSPALTR